MSRVLAVLLGVLVASAARSEDRPAAKYTAEGFTCVLPQGVTVVKRTPAGDFDIHEFTYKGKKVVSAYVGNCPDVQAESLEEDLDGEADERAYSIRSVTKKTIGGGASREVLFVFQFRKEQGWPTRMHFWYDDLSAEMAAVADAIIATTEPTLVEADQKGMNENGLASIFLQGSRCWITTHRMTEH